MSIQRERKSILIKKKENGVNASSIANAIFKHHKRKNKVNTYEFNSTSGSNIKTFVATGEDSLERQLHPPTDQ